MIDFDRLCSLMIEASRCGASLSHVAPFFERAGQANSEVGVARIQLAQKIVEVEELRHRIAAGQERLKVEIGACAGALEAACQREIEPKAAVLQLVRDGS